MQELENKIGRIKNDIAYIYDAIDIVIDYIDTDIRRLHELRLQQDMTRGVAGLIHNTLEDLKEQVTEIYENLEA